MPLELDCGEPFDISNCTLKWGQEPSSEHPPTKPKVTPLRSKWEVVHLKSRWHWEDEEHEALLREWEQLDTWPNGDLFWGHVEAHPCNILHGTREYTAVLMNLPTEWERFHGLPVEACEVTPLEIHGAKLMPKSCDDRVSSARTSRWKMD